MDVDEQPRIVDEQELSERSFTPRTSKRRWVVVMIIATSITVRGFNQSCFGPSNSILAEYFGVEPWQVDWLVLAQSVAFLGIAIPLCLLAVRMSYRQLVLVAIFLQVVGFAFTSVGVSFAGGYALAITGQSFMGFSNIASWTLPTPTAAIWFSKSEVSNVVSFLVCARGFGEAVGAAVPTSVTDHDSSDEDVGLSWTIQYTIMMVVGVVLFILALYTIKAKPDHAPSLAQFKAERSQASLVTEEKSSGNLYFQLKRSAKEFHRVLGILFRDPQFVFVWILFGATNPILRNNNVLLSSVVGAAFPKMTDMNFKVGMLLMGGWIVYTIGGFIAGVLISKTHQYKLIMLIGEIFIFISCLLIFLGCHFKVLGLVYAGVLLQGFIQGWCNTSVFELLAEVSYPISTIFVTMISIIGMGVFRFLYPVIGRALLDNVSVSASTVFPCVISGVGVVVSAVIRPTYHRQLANKL